MCVCEWTLLRAEASFPSLHHHDAGPAYVRKVDLVTETDQKCEALLLERLRAAAPDYKFIGEQLGRRSCRAFTATAPRLVYERRQAVCDLKNT